jgi:hypothetical protein
MLAARHPLMLGIFLLTSNQTIRAVILPSIVRKSVLAVQTPDYSQAHAARKSQNQLTCRSSCKRNYFLPDQSHRCIAKPNLALAQDRTLPHHLGEVVNVESFVLKYQLEVIVDKHDLGKCLGWNQIGLHMRNAKRPQAQRQRSRSLQHLLRRHGCWL